MLFLHFTMPQMTKRVDVRLNDQIMAISFMNTTN